MRIPLDSHSSIPLYRQVENWLRQNIVSGGLPPETRLPATRSLAIELGISRITVKNAYSVLESDGLILAREGSGTFVAPPISAPLAEQNEESAWPVWQMEFLEEFSPEEDSFFSYPQNPDLISFTGIGDPRLFPVNEFARTFQNVLRREGTGALEYGDSRLGYEPLRETIVHILANQGIQSRPQNVLVTSGSQQALALVCQVLLKNGDVVVVERPTYNMALSLFKALKLKIIDIPVDENGMQVELMEPLLQSFHPRLIYTIPNFQNPSGACMTGSRRRLLLALADRYHTPILEDDFVGDLRYDGHTQPAIKALDPGGRVIYVGTFSKMLMPGLRVGYLIADGPVFQKLAHQKMVLDLSTSALMQRALNAFVSVGRYQAHLRHTIRLYRQRRATMLSAIQQHLPEDAAVLPSHGGLFLWVKLPEEISSQKLLRLALEEGVEFAAGTRFFATPADGENFMRLNFATRTPQEIQTGIQRLAVAIRRSGAHL